MDDLMELQLHKINREYLKGRDLSGANLKDFNLEGADLSYANMEGANLIGANLTGATLCYANLSMVNAHGATFKCAMFRNCIMTSSVMHDANFDDATLSHCLANGTSFIGCNFQGTNFYESSLTDCSFSHANMAKASITECNLVNSDFIGAVLDRTIFEHSNLLFAEFDSKSSEEYRLGKILKDPIIGYKKAVKNVSFKINGKTNPLTIPVIVTLEIPAGAIVFSINSNKCRTNKARVLNIEYLVDTDEYLRNVVPETEEEHTMISEIREKPAHSLFDSSFSYIKGDEIEVKNFDLQYNVECSTGIHFFLTKKEAIDFKI